MIKTLLVTALAGGSGALGWVGGSIWPAPPEWTDAGQPQRQRHSRAKLRLEKGEPRGLRELLPAEKFAEIRAQISDIAVAAGEVIMVEYDSGTLEEQLDNLAMDEATAACRAGWKRRSFPPLRLRRRRRPRPHPTRPGNSRAGGRRHAAAKPVIVASPVADASKVFAAKLELCPRMSVSNAPANADGVVSAFKPIVDVKGVRVATFPTPGACMSSGFGTRSSRACTRGSIITLTSVFLCLRAATGTIIEMKYRDDYGNMMLIDHGGGVYTRYAHLASFVKGVTPGASVKAGDSAWPDGQLGQLRDPDAPALRAAAR